MICAYAATRIVHAVVHFAIADELTKGPVTAEEISARCGTDPHVTLRLLQACASLGLVVTDRQLRFSGAPLLQALRRDAPVSSRDLAARVGRLGAQFWEYCTKNPAEAVEFSAAVSEMTAVVSQEVAKIIDTRSIRLAADVGGGVGAFVQALMRANPRLHGILFDRPDRVATASLASQWHGMRARLSVMGGDFLSFVPSADLYLLKYILHDWDAVSCVRILDSCRRSLRAGGRVVVIELQLGKRDEHGAVLVAPPGRERTLTEYEELYSAAGLRLLSVTPTVSGMAVMQAAERDEPSAKKRRRLGTSPDITGN